MSNEHPDRDSLSAYLEKALSIDANQWIEQHLAGCSSCRSKLERERAFLGELDKLQAVEAPADFGEGVMARVAQCPAYHPGTEVPWRRIGAWTGAAATAVVLLLAFVGWVLVAGPPQESVEGAEAVSGGIVWFFETAKQVYFIGLNRVEGVWSLFQIIFTVLFGIVDFFRNSGLAVQLALLLATVSLNYAFMRMVLNYHRRQ